MSCEVSPFCASQCAARSQVEGDIRNNEAQILQGVPPMMDVGNLQRYLHKCGTRGCTEVTEIQPLIDAYSKTDGAI